MEAKEVSRKCGENSPICEERASMSAADDVLEMQGLTTEIADLLVGKGALLKERVGAVLKEINSGATEPITENRALEFMKGKARRVDAWEKENAERRVAELRRREREREISRLLVNLNRTAAYLRTTDPDGHRDDVAAIERTLRLAGVLDRTLAASTRDTDLKGGEG